MECNLSDIELGGFSLARPQSGQSAGFAAPGKICWPGARPPSYRKKGVVGRRRVWFFEPIASFSGLEGLGFGLY